MVNASLHQETRAIQALDAVPQWNDHPHNARNWSTFRKIYTHMIVSSIGFVSTFATSVYSPGHEDAAREFHISLSLALLPLSTYALGLSFGPVIGSPLSETYGRKFVYLLTTPLFALFILGSGFCKDIASLCICRFFAGIFGAPGVSIASATIADMTPPEKRGVPLAIYYAMPFMGSVLGPMVGGPVAETRGWRWTQWTTLFLAALVFPMLGFVHESYRKVLIRRIARRDGLDVPDDGSDSAKLLRYFFTTTVLRPVHMLFSEPIVCAVCVYCAFQFALLYTFIIGSPHVFATTYSFSVSAQSLSFCGLVAGIIAATLTQVGIDYCVYQSKYCAFRRTTPNADFPPEHRLYSSMAGSLILPVGLFLFAWTARPSIHWMVPTVAQAITMLGSLLTYVSANMYMVDTYGPLYGASAAGANNLARYVLTAAFPLFTLQMYERLGTDWATTLLAFCTVAMAPIPWVLWKWGPKLRGRSRYERER